MPSWTKPHGSATQVGLKSSAGKVSKGNERKQKEKRWQKAQRDITEVKANGLFLYI